MQIVEFRSAIVVCSTSIANRWIVKINATAVVEFLRTRLGKGSASRGFHSGSSFSLLSLRSMRRHCVFQNMRNLVVSQRIEKNDATAVSKSNQSLRSKTQSRL